jgi:hypothetical protein
MAVIAQQEALASLNDTGAPSSPKPLVLERPVWRGTWYASQVALILSLAIAAYCVAWEYSTRAYLRGFSDAVIPASATSTGKVEAILTWMSHGPARDSSAPDEAFPERDPSETLNYTSLLRTCGSATNAFINLANTAQLPARRLLLRDDHGTVIHVVAEVLIDGRWIVVDPAFRTIMKDPDGHPLTRKDLIDSSNLAFATSNLRGYSADYNYRNTTHLHTARYPFGNFLSSSLATVFPNWEDSPLVSLIVERTSLAATILSIGVALALALLRIGLVFLRRRSRVSTSQTLPASF